ncbi:hypothetical protein [Undibacterium sp. Ji22W]|uniref:hypothetical protein n=1 Tax=Undibacterium sp. Ji22W TaxID=3413038 RepID=UPI003BF2CB2F
MAEPLKAKKKALLSKIETTYGVDPVPTVGSNGVIIKNIELTPMEMDATAREMYKPYFGNDEDTLALVYAKLSFETEVTGSGTAGTPPPIAHLLRSCCISETILATAHTATATAGTINTISLGVGASATNGAYVGLTVYTTAGAALGQSGVVKSYDGATKIATMTAPWATAPDATTVYEIPAQVSYRRITDNPESITHYAFFGKVLHKLTGARGSVSTQWTYKKAPMAKFSYTGVYVPVTDADAPAVSFTDRKKPLAVNSTNTKNIKLHGFAGVVLSDLSIDIANEVVFRALPGMPDSVSITDSKPSGSITQQATTVATKDWFAAIRNIDIGAFTLTHGVEAGNIIKVDAPRVQLTKPSYSEEDGVQMLQSQMKFLPDLGNDEVILTFL